MIFSFSTLLSKLDQQTRLLCLLVGIVFVALLMLILVQTHGHFIYTLDDAYIHLALSDQLSHFHYGINAGENSAPSSSILYPFFLAPFAPFPFHAWMPLLVNFAATMASALLIYKILLKAGYASWGEAAVTFITIALLLAFNIIGIAFTGLEHSLQIMLALAVLYGLLQLPGDRAVSWLFMLAIVLCPLIRFEGLGIVVAAIAVFVLHRRYREAAVLGASTALLLTAYALTMISMGLPPLPSSVMSKSDVSADLVSGTLGLSFIGTRLALFYEPRFLTVLVLTILIIVKLLRETRDSVSRTTGLYAVLLFFGYAAAGKFDSYARYDIYLSLSLTLTLLIVWRKEIIALPRRWLFLLLALLPVFTAPYLARTIAVPLDANSIYLQHYQMHRFAVDYLRAPVAVNDLGLVAYRNPDYVLDLWGLGSETARKQRARAASPEWMQPLAEAHGVKLAMIYRKWFAQGIPSNWVHVADLSLTGTAYAVGEPVVNFYRLPGADANEVRRALLQFANSLPKGSQLELAP